MAQEVEDNSLEKLEVEELQKIVKQTRAYNNALRKENRLLDSFCSRVGIENIPNDTQTEEISLTMEQRFIIATSELKELHEESQDIKEESEKSLDELRSLREETDIRIAEMKKEAYEFRRDIVSGSLDQRTGKIMAEKLDGYFEQKLKAKQALVEKLHLKNVTLKAQIQKIESQLQHKEDMGDMFLPIDFDQLKIENQQYQEKIEERNDELLQLKVTAGNTIRILSNHKKKLYNLSIEHDKLKSDIKGKEDSLSRLNDEMSRVGEDKSQAKKVNQRLKQAMEEYRVPQVIEYVKLNAELAEAQKQIKDWERKIDIAHLATKSLRNDIRKSTIASLVH